MYRLALPADIRLFLVSIMVNIFLSCAPVLDIPELAIRLLKMNAFSNNSAMTGGLAAYLILD